MSTLTPEQQAAVQDPALKSVIVAPPGSGKTHTLASRCAAVLDRRSAIPGTRALALTFTNRSAAELKERAPGAEACTFHGLAIRLRRMCDSSPFSVYDEIDRQDVACLVGEELGILKPDGYKDRRRASEKVLGDPAGRRRYRALMRQARAVDYDMLVEDGLGYADRVGEVGSFTATHLLLDEMQDTDPRQWDLVQRLRAAALTQVGDVRQSIYAFRRADPTILLDAFQKPELGWSRHALTANFRSVPEVVALGNRIARGMLFHAPEMVATRETIDGARTVQTCTFGTPDSEAEHVARWVAGCAEGWESGPPRAFVLGRTWGALEVVRDALTAAGTLHLYLGDAANFWAAEPVKMLLRAASLCLNPHQDLWTRLLAQWPVPRLRPVELARAAEAAAMSDRPLCHVLAERHPEAFGFWAPEWQERCRRGWSTFTALEELERALGAAAGLERTGRTTKAAQARELLSRVATWQEDAEDASLPAFLDWLATKGPADDAPEAPFWLMTGHGSKGLEAPAVAVVGLDERGFRGEGEERRLFFVAATRARDRLLLTRSETRRGELVGPGNFWLEAAADGSESPAVEEAAHA